MQAWENFLVSLEGEFGSKTVTKWLRSLEIDHFDACNIYLRAKDSFQICWIKEHILLIADKQLVNNNQHPIKIHLTEGKRQLLGKEVNKIIPENRQFHFDYDPNFILENLITTENNQLTYTLLLETVQQTIAADQNIQGQASFPLMFNPFYLYGPEGVGKTHLLVALAQAYKEKGVQVVYANAKTFTDHVISAIRSGEMSTLRTNYRNVDVLIIDDVQEFSRKWATQEEFFHTFNTLHTAGKQIIVSASCVPNDLQEIEQRLISRFEWGIVLPIHSLNEIGLKQLLHKKAENFKVSMAPRLEDYLLKHFSSAISLSRALEAMVLRCSVKSVTKRHSQLAITLEQAKRVLDDLLKMEQQASISPEKIIQTVAEHFGILVEDICGRQQKRECLYPRQLAMFICRTYLKMAYTKIGRLFFRDHTTVINGVKVIEKAIEREDAEITTPLRLITFKLKNNPGSLEGNCS